MTKDEKELTYHQLSIPVNESKCNFDGFYHVFFFRLWPFRLFCFNVILFVYHMLIGIRLDYYLNDIPPEPRFGVKLFGSFDDDNSDSTNYLFMEVQLLHTNVYAMDDENVSSDYAYKETDATTYQIPIVLNVDDIDTAKEVKREHTFQLSPTLWEQLSNTTALRLRISSNLPVSFPINMVYDPTPIDKNLGVIYAAVVLLGLYVLIIWEVVHRTFAAMVASTMSIGLLAMMNQRPTMPQIMSWIDVETLLLLFGMMILVAILSESGIFDYLAVYAFKVCSAVNLNHQPNEMKLYNDSFGLL